MVCLRGVGVVASVDEIGELECEFFDMRAGLECFDILCYFLRGERVVEVDTAFVALIALKAVLEALSGFWVHYRKLNSL